MIYQNDKMRIVPFERSKHMTEEYRSWFNDPEATKYNSHGLFPYTPGAMLHFVKTVEDGSDSKIVWAIEIISPEIRMPVPGKESWTTSGWKHIGNCSLDRINWINRSAEFTIVLGRERGKGYGKQACMWMLDHAFLKLNMNRVWTGTAEINVGMRRVCESVGMELEGTFHDGMFLNGKFVNIVMYGITRHTWNTCRWIQENKYE